MGGDRRDAKGLGGVPTPGSKADNGDDVNMWGGRGVVIPPNGGGNGSRGTSHHRRLHQETEVNHSGKVGLTLYL